MNKQITRLAVGALVLLSALIVGTTYWQTFAVAGLADRQDNALARVAQFTVDRGKIYTARGHVPLAMNRKRKVDGQTYYFRKYPNGYLAPHIIGYSTQSRSRAGLERSQNDYLTGANGNLSSVDAARARQAQRRHAQGQRPAAHAQPARAADGGAAARGEVRRRSCDRAEDRTHPRARIEPDVQPEPDREGLHGGRTPPYERVLVLGSPVRPRDPGPLSAGLDVQGRHGRRRTRQRRVQAELGVHRPRLLRGIRQARLERRQPREPGDVRQGTLAQGLQHSINSVFCNIGKQIGAGKILEYAKRFGFYATPDLELPADAQSPSGLYKNHKLFAPRHPEYQVDPGRLAFGQERMLARRSRWRWSRRRSRTTAC